MNSWFRYWYIWDWEVCPIGDITRGKNSFPFLDSTGLNCSKGCMEKLRFSINMESWNDATIVSFSSPLFFGGGVCRYPLSVSSLKSVEGMFLWYRPFIYDELGNIF